MSNSSSKKLYTLESFNSKLEYLTVNMSKCSEYIALCTLANKNATLNEVHMVIINYMTLVAVSMGTLEIIYKSLRIAASPLYLANGKLNTASPCYTIFAAFFNFIVNHSISEIKKEYAGKARIDIIKGWSPFVLDDAGNIITDSTVTKIMNSDEPFINFAKYMNHTANIAIGE